MSQPCLQNSDAPINAQAIKAAVERVYRHIERERMADLPILNPALSVEAIGFRDWQGYWLGVLITPWCMNLMLMPLDPENGEARTAGSQRLLGFPGGEFEFIAGHDDDLGPLEFCSLYSPVNEFIDQAAAVATAEAAINLLFDAALQSVDPDAPAPPSQRQVSRRDLLRGSFLRDQG